MANIWQKAYNRIFWRNRDKGAPYTPLGESKLLPQDASLNEMDDRILVLNTTKADQSDLLTCVASITLNQTTGILTITLKNGSTSTIDTGLSKLAVNFDYDADPTSPHYQQIVMEMKDGTYKYIDLSALITQFEFLNTSTISWTVANDGTVQATIVNGSVTSSHLSPEVNAQINGAQGYSEESEAWAVGQKNGTDVPSTAPQYHNNSKYYAEQAEASLSNTVRSFNGRNGAVAPTDGDYNIGQISPLNGVAVGQIPVVQNVGTAQEPVYKFGMQFVSGGGIGTCNSIEPFSLAYLVTVNAGFNVAIGSYLSVIFANDFYYNGGNPLRLSVNNQLYEVRINGDTPATGKIYVKSGYAGIFVYDGTYFQLIGTSGGGHVIQNQSGNAMAQEDAMQFADAFVSDDSINGRTIVENIKEVLPADYDSTTDEGIIVCDDGNDVPIGEIDEDVVSVTADGVKTYRQLLNDLFQLIDYSLVTPFAKLVINGRTILTLVDRVTTLYRFSGETTVDNSNIDTQFISISSANSLCMVTNNNTPENISSNILSAGVTITLYYGASSSIINLLTDARHCMMSDGITSVEGALTWKYVASVTDHNAISIPTGAREIFCVGEFGNVSVMFPTVVGNARSGYYSSANDNGDIYVAYSNSQLVVSNYLINGLDVISQGVRVYYK